jgi:hypothetical protein
MEWLILIAVVVLGVPAWAWLTQERMIFFPQPVVSTAHLPARASPLEVVAADGAHLRGWIVKGTVTPAPAVIYFGGNAEEVSWTLGDARWPREWTIVGLNYRGYGASEGEPGERELNADALAIYDAVARREDIDPRRIVVFGRSIGTALAAHLAAERPVAGAVLVSPFDSLTPIGEKHYPWLPVSLLLRHRFDALPDAQRNTMPPLKVAIHLAKCCLYYHIYHYLTASYKICKLSTIVSKQVSRFDGKYRPISTAVARGEGARACP